MDTQPTNSDTSYKKNFLSILSDRENGVKAYHSSKNELFKRNIQEHRLCAMKTRHQLEIGTDTTYAMTAFDHKGVIVIATKSGLLFMYLEQTVNPEKDNIWAIYPEFHGLKSLKPSRIENVCSTVVSTGDQNYEYFMFVQNIFIGGEAHLKPIPRKTDVALPQLQISRGSYYFPRRAVWSCDWSRVKGQFAFGGEQFVCLDGLDCRNRVTIPIKGNVHSVTFRSEGNILFCGTHKGEVQTLDLRAGIKPVSKFYVAKGVSKMALINGDQSMVASCMDNSLAQVDLRRNKVRFFYPEHHNEHLKIPFSFSEMTDTLCAVGQDEVIRFWSLNGGDFLYYLKPNNDYQPYAWYSEQWCTNSDPKYFAKGIVAVAGPSVYLLDL